MKEMHNAINPLKKRATYYLDKANADWVRQQSKLEDRSASYFVDHMIQRIREKGASDAES